MPQWALIVSVAGGLVAVATLVVGGIWAWRAYTNRALLRLVARMQAVEAACQALEGTLARLASADEAALAEFASDAESVERRALHEVATRARLLTEELDRIPMPRALVAISETAADAAWIVWREASRVEDEHDVHAALDAVASVEMQQARAYVASARSRVTEACVERGLNDYAVYGGGLYL